MQSGKMDIISMAHITALMRNGGSILSSKYTKENIQSTDKT